MGRNAQYAAALSLAATLAASAARAEDGQRDFCADRPGKNTPACILDVGRVQLEMSLTDYTHDRQGGVTTDTTDYGDVELRFGLTPTLETEIAWSPYVVRRTFGGGAHDHVSGSGDVTFSLRQSLRNPDGSGFSAAIQPFVSAPTGRKDIGAGAWQGGVIVPLTWQLSEAVGIGLTPKLSVLRDQDGHGSHLAYTLVAAAGRQVGPVNLGADIWVNRDDDPSGAITQASFDLDAAWQPASLKDIAFDVGVNTGLNHNTPDVEAYVGVARRF